MRKISNKLMPSLRGAWDILYDAFYKVTHRNARRPPAGGPFSTTGEDGKQTYFRQSSRH